MHENETMTPRERVETTLEIKEPDRVPFIPAFHCAPARLTGITVEEYFLNIPKSYETVRKVWDMFGGFDMYSGCSPILWYYLPFPGSHSMFYFDWTLPKGNIPEQMNEKEIMKREDYDLLIEKGFQVFNRKPELMNELTRIIAEFSKLKERKWLKEMDVLTLAESIAEPPFEIISFLRSFNKFLVDMVEIPEKIVMANDATEEEFLNSLDLQFKAVRRKNVTQFCLVGFSRIATNHISPKKFELFWPSIKKMTNFIIKNDFIAQFHLDNDYTDVLEYFTEFPKGKIMFHLDLTDIFKAKEILGDRACIMGNIPPQITGRGTAKQVEDYCKNQIEACMENGGYMLCSSCLLPDEIPAANLKVMKESVMKYGFYRK